MAAKPIPYSRAGDPNQLLFQEDAGIAITLENIKKRLLLLSLYRFP